MFNNFWKFVKDCFTTSDGISGDIGRVIWMIGILSLVFFEGWMVITKGLFDPTVYATAFAALLLSGATNLLIKKTTEPVTPSNNDAAGTKTVEMTTKKTITVEKDGEPSNTTDEDGKVK